MFEHLKSDAKLVTIASFHSSKNSKISSQKTSKHSSLNDFLEYNYRFFILFMHASANLFTAITYITCSPIATDLQNIYNYSYLTVSMTSLIYMFTFIPINFPGDYIMDHLGLRIGMFFGVFFTIIGAWVRIFINESFLFVLLGQFISSLGQPFIMNSPAKIAATWFNKDNRVKATTFLSIIGPLGIGAGFLIPGIVMGNEKLLSIEEKKAKIYDIMFYEALILSVLNLPTFIFFKKKPRTPPSFSENVEKIGYRNSFAKTIRNKNYLLFLIYHGLVYGCFNSQAVIMNLVLKPFGYTDFDNGLVGASLIVFGLIGSCFICYAVSRKNQYKFWLIVCTIGYILSVFLMILLLDQGNIYILLISVMILGFFGLPILPISFEFACEINFPIGETFTCGLLVCFVQLVAIICSLFLEGFLRGGTKGESKIILAILDVVLVCGGGFLLFVKENLRRKNMEKNEIGESIRCDVHFIEK